MEKNTYAKELGKYEVIIEKDRPIIMKDDTRLYCDIYRPNSDEKFPALVGFSPFGKVAQEVGRKRAPIKLGKVMYEQGIEISGIDEFVSNGYVVVVVNPRGIGNSEGYSTGLLSKQDQEDCFEVIRWTGHYHSNGSVGMIGCGYAGKIQPLVAAMNPPYLKAIMPIEVMDDLYKDCYPGGILSDINYPLCSYIPHTRTISEAELENDEETLKEMLEKAKKQPEIATNSYYYRGLDSFPPRHYTWNIDILLHPENGEWWQRRSFIDKKISIPTHIVGIYYEYGNSTQSAFEIFNKLKGIPKKLTMLDAATQKTAPYNKPIKEQLRWYDHFLKNIDTGLMQEPEIKLLVLGENKYRYETVWPAENIEYTNYYLSKDKKLISENQNEVYNEELKHIPPTKQSQMPEDVPVLTYTSKAFDSDEEVAGDIKAVLFIDTDIDNAHLTVKLWDKDENSGYRTLLSIGNVKCKKVELIDKDKSIYKHVVDLVPIDNMFKKGHQIEMEIKTMDQQSFAFNELASLPRLYTSGRVAGAHPMATNANYKIYMGEKFNSHISLPFLKGEKHWVK